MESKPIDHLEIQWNKNNLILFYIRRILSSSSWCLWISETRGIFSASFPPLTSCVWKLMSTCSYPAFRAGLSRGLLFVFSSGIHLPLSPRRLLPWPLKLLRSFLPELLSAAGPKGLSFSSRYWIPFLLNSGHLSRCTQLEMEINGYLMKQRGLWLYASGWLKHPALRIIKDATWK